MNGTHQFIKDQIKKFERSKDARFQLMKDGAPPGAISLLDDWLIQLGIDISNEAVSVIETILKSNEKKPNPVEEKS